jgi:hypothetical protein
MIWLLPFFEYATSWLPEFWTQAIPSDEETEVDSKTGKGTAFGNSGENPDTNLAKGRLSYLEQVYNLIQSIGRNDTQNDSKWNLQMWSLPSNMNPLVISSLRDWAWAYPENKTITKQQYMANRYLPSERDPRCKGFCCIGAAYYLQEPVESPHCQSFMDFMFEFQPLQPKRDFLYSLVDSIMLFPKEQEVKILVAGDSVLGQIFHAVLCEFMRNEKVAEIIYVPTNGDSAVKEAVIRLKVDSIGSPSNNVTRQARVYYSRSYFLPSASFLESLFKPFQVSSEILL